jgi:hypothetical protein
MPFYKLLHEADGF